MLARRLTTILPEMSLAEALETTRIHRVEGPANGSRAMITICPCAVVSATLLPCARAMVVRAKPSEDGVVTIARTT